LHEVRLIDYSFRVILIGGQYILGGFGCPIAELLDLERLSTVCEKEKRWSFFFTAAPLNVP